MALGKESQRGEYPSQHIIKAAHDLIMTFTDDVNLGYLVTLVPGRLLYCRVTVPFPYSSLWK